jgi:hypothetical protein
MHCALFQSDFLDSTQQKTRTTIFWILIDASFDASIWAGVSGDQYVFAAEPGTDNRKSKLIA